jgi:CRISPR/Cas system-associated protein Csm6
MEITYRRTVQVREYESITIEAKTTSESFFEGIVKLEEYVDAEIHTQRDKLRNQYKQEEFADDEDLS